MSQSVQRRRTDSDSDTETERCSCPECGGRVESDQQRGERACVDCGLVVDDVDLDRGPNWRRNELGDGKDSRHVGDPRTVRRHHRNLGTQLTSSGVAGDVSPQKRFRLHRMEQLDRRRSSRERNARDLVVDVRRIANGLGLGDGTEKRACQLVQDAHSAGIAPGRSLEALAVAAVVAAVRDSGLPIPMDEVRQHSDVDRRPAYHTFLQVVEATDATPQPVAPAEHIPRICSELDADADFEQHARQVALAAQEREIHIGSDPASVAAGVVYAVSKLPGERRRTQTAISEAAGCCKATIRRYRDELVDQGVLEAVAGGSSR